MSKPTKSATKARRNAKRSHHALKGQTLSQCEKCGKAVLPHKACGSCGTYRGRTVS